MASPLVNVLKSIALIFSILVCHYALADPSEEALAELNIMHQQVQATLLPISPTLSAESQIGFTCRDQCALRAIASAGILDGAKLWKTAAYVAIYTAGNNLGWKYHVAPIVGDSEGNYAVVDSVSSGPITLEGWVAEIDLVPGAKRLEVYGLEIDPSMVLDDLTAKDTNSTLLTENEVLITLDDFSPRSGSVFSNENPSFEFLFRASALVTLRGKQWVLNTGSALLDSGQPRNSVEVLYTEFMKTQTDSVFSLDEDDILMSLVIEFPDAYDDLRTFRFFSCAKDV